MANIKTTVIDEHEDGTPDSQQQSKMDKRREVTKDRIARAAYRVFAEHGVDALSMREIAKELGVSPMMPYKYYPSKEHLLLEMRMRAFERLGNAMRLAMEKAQDPETALAEMCVAYLDMSIDRPWDYRLMFDYWSEVEKFEPEKGSPVEFWRESIPWNLVESSVSNFLQHSGASSRVDVSTAAHVVWTSLHGLASLHVAKKLRFDRTIKDLRRPLILSILNGLKNTVSVEFDRC